MGLRYAIKKQEGHHVEPPLQLWDGKTPIPDVPPLGSVDVIIAGFPWYGSSMEPISCRRLKLAL